MPRFVRFGASLNPHSTLQSLRRAPAFTVATVLTFALGIGVNAAIFAAANAVLLHPLPGVDARRLVAIETQLPSASLQHARVSPANVWQLSDRRDVFSAVGGYRLGKVTMRDAGVADEIDAATTAGAFLEALGAPPLLGRLFDAREAEHGDQHVAVLSFEFWQARFGGDVSIVGRSLTLNDSTYRVIGVLAKGAAYPRQAALWTPRALEPFMEVDRSVWAASLMTTIARPRPGVGAAQIRAELDRQMAASRAQHRELAVLSKVTLEARPLVDALAGQMRPVLIAIFFCGGFVLLMACANVASLQLVRVSALARELAVRAALGASRWTLVRRVLAESLTIAVSGGALGVIAGAAAVEMIRRSSSSHAVSLADVRLDPMIVAALFGLIVVAALISALAAVRTTARVDPADVLRASSRAASAGKQRDRFLRAAVVTQLALAISLLLGATTAVRSLSRLIDVDPGFAAEGVTSVRMILPSPRYSPNTDGRAPNPSNVTVFYQQLVANLRQRPGIAAVGLVSGAPFGYVEGNEHKIFISLTGAPPSQTDPFPDFWRVNDDYFRSMGIPLRAGRAFSAADESLREPVAIIDDVLARRLFGEKSPIGERLQFFGRVVGVVGSVKKASLATSDEGSLYLPHAPWTANDLTLVIRSTFAPSVVGTIVQTAARSLDPTLAIGDVSAITTGIERSTAPQRFAARVTAGFAGLSMALAIIGICGVMLYSVSQRRKELGIRLALGATPEMLRRFVLRQGVLLGAVGLGIGVAVYWVIAGWLSAVVFGISPRDPATIASGVIVLAVFVVAATYLPAFRAGRVDPLASLSAE
jgi:putative ABC transport system permease protein